jgi:hypothetical protein
MWLNFEECAINGVSHAARALRDGRYGLMIIWVIVTLILAALTAVILYESTTEYSTYPVLTTVEVEYQIEGVDFPTVTFCNHNPMGCDYLFRISLDLPDLWKESGCSEGQQIEDYIRKTLVAFTLDKSSTDHERLINLYFEKDASSSPMTDLLAHLYIDSPEVYTLMHEAK